MQPDSLRGTPLEKYAGLTADSVCLCSHTFQWHSVGDVFYNRESRKQDVNARCTYCTCIAFTINNGEVEEMADAQSKSAEQNGYEQGRQLSAVFVIRDAATYQDKVALGMRLATREGLNLANGAAFVTGFVGGLDSGGERSARTLTLEQKLDKYLENELDKRLSAGADRASADSNWDSGSDRSAPVT